MTGKERNGKMTSQDMKKSLQNPATHYWVLNRIKEIDNMDVLDAARDSDIVATYARLRLEESEASYMQAVE